MEAFLRNTAYKVRAAIRAGDRDALQREIEFCRSWGGPLGLVALVGEVHLEVMERGPVGAHAAAKGEGQVLQGELELLTTGVEHRGNPSSL